MHSASLVLAHQGGWDEALMVVVPVGLFVALFRAASTKAAREQHDRDSKGQGAP